MADSAAKRRKTSPSTFTPIDAPTPSRIPVPIAQDNATTTSARRPSFASPTKSSLSRHHPQILNRPTSSGAASERPFSRGRNLQDVFAKALGEVPSANVARSTNIRGESLSRSASTNQENEPEVMARFTTQTQTHPVRATTPKRSTKAIGGALSTKPRRLSRSPVKRPERSPINLPDADPIKDLPSDFNPFQKKGLRRSPVPGQAEPPSQQEESDALDGIVNPFRKTGLRRSPVSSQPIERVEPPQNETPTSIQAATTISTIPPQSVTEDLPQPQIEEPAYISTTPTEPAPTKVGVSGGVAQDLLVQPDEVQPSDASEMAIEHLRSLRQPRGPIVPSMADLFTANRADRPEPELPPTPTQRGIPDPMVTTPPTGIHNTPSKKAKRSKAFAEKLKSSPLKPRDPPPRQPSKEKEAQPDEQVRKAQPKPAKRRKSARFLLPEDPHAAKKKTRDDLLKELQQLQADISLANKENERLRRAEYKSSTSAPSNPDELLAMLTRATATERPEEAKPKSRSIFKSIGAFLPFHPRRKPAPLAVSEKPTPSHLPIALEDPLPYLQAFTPLTYSSTITLLTTDSAASDESSQEREPILMQKHFITASHPSGLFTTRFAMTVDTAVLSISAIDILRLDMNAEKELGTFIRGRARDEGQLGKDVTVICWAMSRWTEVSVKRAQFWCAVDQEFGTSDARIKSLQTKRKRKRAGSVFDKEENSVTVNNDQKIPQWTRKQLLPHFGRSSMELLGDDVELRFEWKISFDWTGEVESSISAAARVPKHWEEADERKSLAKVPQTFDKLKNELGPLSAVRAMVGLLMQPS